MSRAVPLPLVTIQNENRVVTMTFASSELSLGAQTSYAELFDMAKSIEATRFAALRGSFHQRQLKGNTYIYFNFRDTDGRTRSAYVGPNGPRTPATRRRVRK